MYEPYVCILTHSSCYQRTTKMTIKGILWHSTGANNPNLKRYVQPYEGDANYDEAIAKLGYNRNRNDWNHQKNSVGVNAFIGKYADGSVGTVQTLPWDFKPWGCGGSANNGWIQFEICEDGLKDKAYAQRVWDEAIALSVYLCQMFNLNPSQMAKCGNKLLPVVTCHNDASKVGCASSHADINHWFPKILGKDMDDARSEIYAKMMGTVPPVPSGAKFGIDVSKWQNGLKISQAKVEGVEYVIAKIGGSDNGRYKDVCFDTFYNQAKSVGMPIGTYYIGGDFDEASAIASAEHCISLLKGHQFEYPIYYDVERDMLTKTNPSQLTKIVNAFCKKVESAGYWVGIYASESTFKSEVNDVDLKHFCHWIARWGKNRPSGADMWQFGGETNLIRSNKICGKICDQDYCYVDYPTKIKARKLNGWDETPVKPDVAKATVKKGSKGENAKLLQINLNQFGYKLVTDGIFGVKSTNVLKAWQRKYGLVDDGIYGKKSEAKMRSLVV